MLYAQSFTVTGRFDFPSDMLRYDRCYPADSESALTMFNPERSPFPQDGGRLVERTVKLRRWVQNKKDMPTLARWSSFGWLVKLETVFTHKI